MLAVARRAGLALEMTTHRLFCRACGVFAGVQLAGRRGDGSIIFSVASLCEICRCNYLHAVKP